MIALVLLGLLVVVGAAATVVEVCRDRPRTPPTSRFVDPDFLPPAVRTPRW